MVRGGADVLNKREQSHILNGVLFFSDLSSLSRLSAGGAGGPATLSAGPRWDRAPGERAGGRPEARARRGAEPSRRPLARPRSRLPTLRRHSDGTLGGIHTHFFDSY